MTSRHFFSLDALQNQKCDGGNITHVTSKEVPGFVNISFAALKLNKQGSQEPIWHPNANKLGYCLQGEALVSLRSPDGANDFMVSAGDMFFIPQGFIHYIANTCSGDTHINFALNATQPETMCLSKAIGSLSNNVFSTTFNTSPDFIQGLKQTKNNELIKTLSSPNVESSNTKTNHFKFNVANSSKPILTKGGYVQLGTKTNLPVLDGLGILRFGLNPKGIVEPHWHTNAGELVYIVKGSTRITVLAPDGTIDKLEVNGGQGAFAPASYFHNIENIGNDDVEVIAFFSHSSPDYIGIGEAIGSYSNEVLGSIFNVAPSYFDKLKKPEAPLVIVPI